MRRRASLLLNPTQRSSNKRENNVCFSCITLRMFIDFAEHSTAVYLSLHISHHTRRCGQGDRNPRDSELSAGRGTRRPRGCAARSCCIDPSPPGFCSLGRASAGQGDRCSPAACRDRSGNPLQSQGHSHARSGHQVQVPARPAWRDIPELARAQYWMPLRWPSYFRAATGKRRMAATLSRRWTSP